MARIIGDAGEWTRVRGVVLGLWPLFLSVLIIGFSLAMFFVNVVAGLALLVLSASYGCWSLVRGLRHVERFFIGARGEERVAGLLKSLPDNYHVFNDFVACKEHIDHVVVGPTGVFAVETKNWRGQITIEDGHIFYDGRLPSGDPLKQVLWEASLVRNELARRDWKGVIKPVLVFASDTFRAQVAEIRGVVVMNSSYIKSGFVTDYVALQPAELDRLVRLMENT